MGKKRERKVVELSSPQNVVFQEVPQAQIGGIFRLPLDIIIPNPNQPRRFFEEATLVAMAETMRERHDVEYPLIVSPRMNGGSKLIAMIVDGERRYRASKIAGLTEVSCYIREMMDDDQLFMVSAKANLCRKEMSPIEMANIVRKLMERYSWSQARVASELGLSQPSIGNLLRYFKLHHDVQSLVACGRLEKGVALQLSNYDKSRQLELLGLIKNEVEARGRPFSPNDLLLFVREMGEKLRVGKAPVAKRRRTFTHCELLLKQMLSRVEGTRETARALRGVSNEDLLKWSQVNPLDVLTAVRELQNVLKNLEDKLDEAIG